MTAVNSTTTRAKSTSAPVRGTQLLVEHMGDVFKRPLLTGIEVLWRWAVGIPILYVLSVQWQHILAAYPLENSGFNSLDSQNPWVAVVQLAGVWTYYEPHVVAVLIWLVPVWAVAWAVASGLGRMILLRRMQPGLPARPVAMIALHGAWVALFLGTIFGWLRSLQWAAATHMTAGAEPNLVGLAIWSIWLSLSFFAVFALVSWIFSIAPLLMLLERRSALSALGQAVRLGKGFSSKLAEINLVMGIIKLGLVVLAMVFSAAPLPFSDELGPSALRMVTGGALALYLVENDFFQVVRLKAFVEFWKVFRGGQSVD